MFGFKTLAAFAVTALVGVSALPSPGAEAGLAKRNAEAAPLAMAAPVTAREANPLAVRGGGSGCDSVPHCFDYYCTGIIEPLIVKINAAIAIKADVSVFVDLCNQIANACAGLAADLLLVIGVFGGLTLAQIAELCRKCLCDIINALIAIVALLNITGQLSLFVSTCGALVLQIIAVVQAVLTACVGIDLSVLLDCLNALLNLCNQIHVLPYHCGAPNLHWRLVKTRTRLTRLAKYEEVLFFVGIKVCK